MDENNSFLSSYKKNLELQNIGGETELKETKSVPVQRYEEKSTFVKPKKKDMGTLPPFGQKPKFLIPVIIGAVVLIAAALGLVLLLNKGIEVIDFTGWTENDSQLWAKENGVMLQIQKEFNDAAEEGKVVSQSVKKGQIVKKGGFIELIVSKGHDLTVTLPLPDIMSMSKEEIEKWAQDNFMAKVRITGEFNDSVPLGKVIKFEINDATVVDKVSRNTPIYVIVSKGVEDQAAITVTIPNFKEKSLAECYTFANENGLVLTVEEQYDDYVPKGTIISQSVKAQEKVKKGTAVVLAVSKGKMITIPSFSGYTKEKATAYAAQLQIPVTITEKYSGSAAGVLISQSIKAGTVYEEGNIVELKYSLGNKIALASYVGQTRDAIESWAKDLNDKGASITIKVTNSISNAAKGTVIYQDQANALISTKTTINITVSLGKTVFMPDFVIESQDYVSAITREEALAICEELKLIPTFVAEENANVLPGTVWYQNKEPGTEITEGTSITLKYRQSKQVSVPDFVGSKMPESDAKKYSNQLTITIVYADQHVEGFDNQVCEQSLTAGSTVATGSAITLKISPKQTP